MNLINQVTVIAEAGVNHNGDLEMASELIKVAAYAGADIIKFQTFNTEDIVTNNSKKAPYQIRNSRDNLNQSQKEMLENLELSASDHDFLIQKCKEYNIEFLSTAFDIKSLNSLNERGLKRYKIPSGEITNLPYLKHIVKFKKPIIMSTGMSTLNEIDTAVNILLDEGLPRENLTLLQCTTEYPAPMEEINLRVLETFRNRFNVKIGISDHSEGISVPIASVAIGASVIEKHLTLDKSLPGPDHKASIEPKDLEKMIRGIRDIEKALGDGIKKPSISEEKNKKVIRKSIVALKQIKKGDIFSYENIGCKRPGDGISPMQIDNIIGKKSKTNFEKDEMIKL
jgi:N,N'-diacetyllegionaminate synthase